jgi:hypothetical protein
LAKDTLEKEMFMTSSYILAAIGNYAPAFISCAAAAATVLPKPKPGTWFAVVRGVVDVLACNFGNAKNAP